MAKLLKLRRGTTTQHGSFTGAEGEVTIDTDKEVPVVHDGSTAGGHPVAAEDMANVSSANIVERLAAGSIAQASLAADAVDGDNIADDAVGAEHIETLDADLKLADGVKTTFGAGDDIQIWHDAGAGDNIRGAGTKLEIRSPDLQLQNAGSEKYIRCVSDGAVELYYDNSEKFATSADGIEVTGKIFPSSHIDMADDVKLLIGTGDDLEIYHSGTESFVTEGTGDLNLKTTASGKDIGIRSADDIFLMVHTNDSALIARGDGSVELYNNNIKTFETQTNGITVLGPEGGDAEVRLKADEGDDNADLWRIKAADGADFTIGSYSTGSWQNEVTITNAGNLTALGNITAYSDARLKTDIKTIDNALDKVTKLRGVSYKRLDTQEAGIGVIAQEIENVLPEVVEDGSYKSVAYGNVVGVLIEAIKELKAELDEHKKKCPANGGE